MVEYCENRTCSFMLIASCDLHETASFTFTRRHELFHLCHHLVKYVGAIWKAYPHPVLKLSSSIWGTLGKVRPVLRIKFSSF